MGEERRAAWPHDAAADDGPPEDVELDDPEQLAEIELYGELVIAAAASDESLSPEQIDSILGLRSD